MKKILIVTITVLIVIIVIGSLFTNIAGSIYGFYKKIVMGELIMDKFITYTPKLKELNFIFTYPKAWKVAESKGMKEDYSQVHILGPSNKEKTMKVSIALTVYPIKSLKDYFGLERYCDNYIVKRAKYKNFKLTDRRHETVDEKGAIYLELMYTVRLPLYKADAKDVLIKSDAVIFERDGNLYNFAYQNDEREFKRFSFVFKKILESLRFH